MIDFSLGFVHDAVKEDITAARALLNEAKLLRAGVQPESGERTIRVLLDASERLAKSACITTDKTVLLLKQLQPQVTAP